MHVASKNDHTLEIIFRRLTGKNQTIILSGITKQCKIIMKKVGNQSLELAAAHTSI